MSPENDVISLTVNETECNVGGQSRFVKSFFLNACLACCDNCLFGIYAGLIDIVRELGSGFTVTEST